MKSRGGLAATLVALMLLGLWVASPGGLRDVLRERAADLLLAPPPASGQVVVVEVDRDALARFGPWPWDRARLAELVGVIAAAGPAAVALDILLHEPDRLSPAALARRLAAATGRGEIAALAEALPDGDAALAAALGVAPAALGFVLDPAAGADALPVLPILVQGEVALPGLWAAPGLQGPPEALAGAAAGLGLLALDADADGRIRRVPLLALAGDAVRPGLAVEAVRLAEGAGALLVAADPPRLGIGARTVALDGAAMLRIVPAPAGAQAVRSLSVAALADDPAAALRLAGRIVLVGATAPELGGLRPVAGGAALPSVQIQADAVEALLAGRAPVRPVWLVQAETALAALLVAAALLAALRLRPRGAALVVGLGCAAWLGATWAALGTGLLLDAAGPLALAVTTSAAASLLAFTATERRARDLATRFAQRLPPAVVRRIAAAPEVLRLEGETREITALFTDIEGFTAMTERAAPQELVALLDAYLDALTRVVVAHGGMVEKIVGDALHVVFNAPLDLPDHPRAAHRCARALVAAAEAQRSAPLGAKLGLGRTRIGIETGMAVVGDVGGAGRLDYTAHGDVMNTAARLEAMNKTLGTTICIGPVAAARIGHDALRPLGAHGVRGRGAPLDLYTTS